MGRPDRWLLWGVLLPMVCSVWSISRTDLFQSPSEEDELDPGSDESVEVKLDSGLHFMGETLKTVYIHTNGFVSTGKPPSEASYLGQTPASFQMLAVLLGDLEARPGQGKVSFWQTTSPDVLGSISPTLERAFPEIAVEGELKHALVVKWHNMAAHGSRSHGDSVGAKTNTFQLVVASFSASSYAILLYPRDGLQFLSTSIGGESKPLEAGFNQGQQIGWFGYITEGEYYRTTTEEESSIAALAEKTNTGRAGVWAYKVGHLYYVDILPGEANTITGPEQEGAVVTESPRHPEDKQEVETEAPGSAVEDTEMTPLIIQPEPQNTTPDHQPETQDPFEPETETPLPGTTYPNPESTQTLEFTPQTTEAWYPDLEEPQQPQTNEQEYPEPEEAEHPGRTSPERPQRPEVVVVDQDLDVDVFSYNSETCSRTRLTCSAFADCRDYSTGPCCQCRPGFYGNGKDCVAEGKPQRMNGKVNGRVFVGDASTPVQLSNNDLHSYVVANDGRAYVAISSVPAGLGPSLQPLTSLGGVMGWAFALEQPGYQNGFSLIGGVFSRQVEVVWGGGERLSITQEFQGIDEHEHLLVSTSLEGRVPELAPGASVHIQAYQEVYQHSGNYITSSSNREYTVTLPSGETRPQTFQWRQTISFQSCPHDDGRQDDGRRAPQTQQLSVDQIFVMYDTENQLIRYAMSNKIGSMSSGPPEQNPCFTGRHGCDNNAVCRHGDGLEFTCECSTGFSGDGRTCYDVDECRAAPPVCGRDSVCTNQQGSFRCDCPDGFLPGDHNTCIREELPVDHCQTGRHDCDVIERATCHFTGGSAYLCSCLPGYLGDGRVCEDVDECQQGRCHADAVCFNTQGSYICQCRPDFQGDGFHCSPVSTEREPTACERHRESVKAPPSEGLLSFFRPRPAVGQYVPQCDEGGAYRPTQCHPTAAQCWCVDPRGQEVPGTRTADTHPLCIDQAIAPPTAGPAPRPDVIPVAPGARLLFAQSGKMEQIPLDGDAMRKELTSTLLHIPDRVVISVAFDCVDQMVYWSDITGPAISKASLSGGDIIPVITTGLESPEGVAVDHVSRLLFWTDSMRDTVEVSQLDGSQRHVLFDTDLVNPRPIVVDPTYGRLYWADWNRDGPKIETANMDGSERTVLVKDDLGLPNGLTFDPETQLLCWADAGTRKVECWDAGRRVRRQVVSGVQYPFGLASYGGNLFYTDWRRAAVVTVDRSAERETDEFLPQKRSQPYGITVATTQCHQGYNYCFNNGGCSQLCLPRPGGFTCRCPSHGDGTC
ncbi:nidogen-1-like [Gadus chalcogrammus]|uniref:nidogen-1-like n=1 Tax=Gadus chalcogrammus TaxID=1042646 RepID=UPI0024C245E0|nr:nidogen-1-like [Gadus chalcogrammus]